jgi:hypothetical protein
VAGGLERFASKPSFGDKEKGMGAEHWTGAQRWSVILLASTLILVGVYDLIAALFLPPQSTVSVVILDLARKHPILGVAVGIVIGHLFWPQ